MKKAMSVILCLLFLSFSIGSASFAEMPVAVAQTLDIPDDLDIPGDFEEISEPFEEDEGDVFEKPDYEEREERPYHLGPLEFDSFGMYFNFYKGQYEGLRGYHHLIRVSNSLFDDLKSYGSWDRWKGYYDNNPFILENQEEYYLWNALTHPYTSSAVNGDIIYFDNRDVLNKPAFNCTGFDLSVVVDQTTIEGYWEVFALDIYGEYHALGELLIQAADYYAEGRFDFDPISIIAIDVVPPYFSDYDSFIFMPLMSGLTFAQEWEEHDEEEEYEDEYEEEYEFLYLYEYDYDDDEFCWC